MGYSLSWIATNGLAADAVLAALNLERTGSVAEYAQSPLSAAELPSGWFLLVAKGCDHPILNADVLGDLSRKRCHVVACSIEEHVMVCYAEGWRDGARIWRAEHDAQQDRHHLSSEGQLPASFAAAHRVYANQQRAEGGKEAGVDYYFEVPLQTAKSVVGFKHDEETPDFDYKFESLAGHLAQSRRPWWRIWK
jgi:hypothetical protein